MGVPKEGAPGRNINSILTTITRSVGITVVDAEKCIFTFKSEADLRTMLANVAKMEDNGVNWAGPHNRKPIGTCLIIWPKTVQKIEHEFQPFPM